MSLRSLSSNRVSIKSTILALGVSLFALAPATLHAASFTFDFNLDPTSCSGGGCTEIGGSAVAVFNTQPTAAYTDYHNDVTALTFTMADGAVFSYPGSGSALSVFEFMTIAPYTIRDITFSDSIDGNTLTLDTSGTYVLYTPTGDTYGNFSTATLMSQGASATPEPGSLLLLATGLLAGTGTLLRRFQLQRL